MNIPSILRHWFTLAATSATLWLIATLLLSADDAATLTAEVGKLIEPLIIIGVLLITAFWRVALTWISSIFRSGAGEDKTTTTRGGSGGGLPLWVLIGTLAGFMGLLPACTPASLAAARAFPIRIGIQGPDASLSYSSKAGLEVMANVERRSGK